MFKQSLIRLAAAVALCGVASAASASVITLDFEGLRDGEQILNFYNGGTGSLGSSGVNYGVAFGSNALALVDADAGGGGNFANEPTPDTIMFFLTGSAVLNYAPGFTTGFSFWYTTLNLGGTVSVYDDVNAGGNLLGTINLQALGGNCSGDPSGQFCNWAIGALAFNGVAKSIDFGGTVNQVGFDNITFGSTDPNRVPAPATLALVGAALLGLGAARRRSA